MAPLNYDVCYATDVGPMWGREKNDILSGLQAKKREVA